MISPLEKTKCVQGNWIASLYAQINPEIALHKQRGSYRGCLPLLMLTHSRKALLGHFWGDKPHHPKWKYFPIGQSRKKYARPTQ